ncbi:MAG TPA: hypothetical protein VFG72_12765 [Marmoricola sp.]|nr:hypothetical protein [Marmoricola sp.]
MSDGDAGRTGEGEPLGTVGEEAAKLFSALQDWAHDADEHAAHAGTECTWCPVCRTVNLVRQTSPEVKGHLAVAASSLLQAAAGLLATQPPNRDPGVQKIDLDDDASWDESEWDAD